METESQDGIVRFLEEKLGFDKVRSFLDCTSTGLNLKGTIMGSYCKKSYVSFGDPNLDKYNWSRRYPCISKIHKSSELDDLSYLPFFLRPTETRNPFPIAQKEARSREYYVAHSNAFDGLTQTNVLGLGEEIKELIPGSNLVFPKNIGKYCVLVESPDFAFFSSGSRDRRANKVFLASFNLSERIVEDYLDLHKSYETRMRIIVQESEKRKHAQEEKDKQEPL